MSKQEISMLMDELKDLKSQIASMTKDHIIPMRENIATLNTKSRTWGAVAGTIAGGLVAGFSEMFFRK